MTRRTLGTLLIGFIFGFAVTLMLLASYKAASNQPDWYVPPVVAEPPLGYCDNHLACG